MLSLMLIFPQVGFAEKYMTATRDAMMYVNNLRSSDLYKVPGRSRNDPYYVLKDTSRARNFGKLQGFEYINISPSNITPKLKNGRNDFVQISYDLQSTKGNCSAFASALASFPIDKNMGKLKRASYAVNISRLKAGTLLAVLPENGSIGHVVMLISINSSKKYMWVMDQNSGYKVKKNGRRLKQGIVSFHKLYFKDRKNKNDKKDASNYFTFFRK